MNEITRIHLGRQPFTIAVDAHKELQAYLQAIKIQVGSRGHDVIEEVELRMAELLTTERGVTADKVVIAADVAYLKQQLGEPKDFKEEDEPSPTEDTTDDRTAKRLFRDPTHGMLAGVASGLAAYLGIDTLIVRIVFIALTLISGGAGILVYIILWLLVPEAKTNSDRLQMRGKAVTVDSLKELVDRADIEGVARRASHRAEPLLRKLLRIIIGITGAAISAVAAAAAFAVVTAGAFAMLHGGQISGQNIFPVGVKEHILIVSTMVAATAFGVLMLLIGTTMLTMKWKAPAWLTASLIGLFVIGVSLGGALAADAVPRIHDRYEATHHSQTINVGDYTALNIDNKAAAYRFIPDAKRYVVIRYLGNPAHTKLSADVKDGTLHVDTHTVSDQALCSVLCIYNSHELEVDVHGPSVSKVTVSGTDNSFRIDDHLNQQDISFDVTSSNSLAVMYVDPTNAAFREDGGHWTIALQSLKPNAFGSDALSVAGVAHLTRADAVSLETGENCSYGSPVLGMGNAPASVSFNGQATTDWHTQSQAQQDKTSILHCFDVQDDMVPQVTPVTTPEEPVPLRS